MRNFLFLLSLVSFLAFGAKAEVYFSAEAISPLLISGPLARNSSLYKSEVSYMIKLQKNIDMLELKEAIFEDEKLAPEIVTKDVIPEMARSDFPKLYKLLDKTASSTLEVSENAKKFWNTKRPYLEDKRIKLLVKPYANGSYPSSHSAVAQSVARILGLLFDEKREALLNRAEEIAKHRSLVGVHYPHDLQGGREVAFLVVGALMANGDFLEDFENAKQEVIQKIKK